MQFTREIRLIFGFILLAFLMVGVSASYWSIVGPETLLDREDNPRLVEAEARIQRGHIFDRNETVLVETTFDDSETIIRDYLHPSMNGTLGYFSLRYGTGGTEFAFDSLLRGENDNPTLEEVFNQDVLHRRTQGIDIQLTLDLPLQIQLSQALQPFKGAGVVMDAQSGEILAMVSQPTYDPNTLDETWETLIESPDDPFFNRVIQGSYQPGATLQTFLIANGLSNGIDLQQPLESASQAVELEDVTLSCAIPPPTDTLTLQEAYAYGCPNAFASLLDSIGEETLQETFSSNRLNAPTTITGFDAEIPIETATETPAVPDDISLLEQALGQGTITVSPLKMVSVVASLVNQGNAPQPYLLQATREPDSEEWVAVLHDTPSIPYFTAGNAEQIRDLMLNNVSLWDVDSDNSTGGHVALAYSGDSVQTWFIGFRILDDNRRVAIAMVIEDSDDAQQAIQIGIDTLKAVRLP